MTKSRSSAHSRFCPYFLQELFGFFAGWHLLIEVFGSAEVTTVGVLIDLLFVISNFPVGIKFAMKVKSELSAEIYWDY